MPAKDLMAAGILQDFLSLDTALSLGYISVCHFAISQDGIADKLSDDLSSVHCYIIYCCSYISPNEIFDPFCAIDIHLKRTVQLWTGLPQFQGLSANGVIIAI